MTKCWNEHTFTRRSWDYVCVCVYVCVYVCVCVCLMGGYDSITVVYLVTTPNVLLTEVLSWPSLLRIGGVEEDLVDVECLTSCVVPTIKRVCAHALQTCVQQ